MDYRSIINIILDQIDTPFNLSIFYNGSSYIGISIDRKLPDEIIQDLEAKLKPIVHGIHYWNTSDNFLLELEKH